MVRLKETVANTDLQGKIEGKIICITRKASKTVVGQCKGMDRD